MAWFWVVLFVVILLLAAYHVYVSAEHHELHKIRAAFEKVELNILNQLEYESNVISKDWVNFGMLPKETIEGAGYAVQKVFEMLEKEEKEIDHEFIDQCRNALMEIFHGKE